MQSPSGEPFPYGLGWFVWELPGGALLPWYYGYLPQRRRGARLSTNRPGLARTAWRAIADNLAVR